MKTSPSRLSPTDRILVIDDNPDDIYLLVRALRDAGVNNPIDSCESTDLAVSLLVQGAQNGCLPGFIFCDLKMPGKNGFDFLEWRNTQPDLLALPVVITSGSGLSSDVQRATRLGAYAYFVKPLTTDDIHMIVSDQSGKRETSDEDIEKVRISPKNDAAAPVIG